MVLFRAFRVFGFNRHNKVRFIFACRIFIWVKNLQIVFARIEKDIFGIL